MIVGSALILFFLLWLVWLKEEKGSHSAKHSLYWQFKGDESGT